MRLRTLATMLVAGAVLGNAAGAIAQETGSIRVSVFDRETEEPLFAANVLVTSRADISRKTARLTNNDGVQVFDDLIPGTYEVRVSYIGYTTYVEDEVTVGSGQTTETSIPMEVEPIPMEQVVITASRKQEKALDAPASVQMVETQDIERRTVLTPADHLQAKAGVDVMRSGLNQANVVVRGFNNVFSGATLTLVDNRISSVPSLRYNAMNLISTTNDDLERVEIVSGPGSALYGPNSANGVIHMITRSPFEYPGTKISAAAGNRDILLGSLWHAGVPSPTFGYRVSGQYYEGTDFAYVDPVEQSLRDQALLGGADPDTLLIGKRDEDITKAAFEGRIDVQPSDRSLIVLNGGWNQANNIELTGLGAAQAVDWTYGYGQARFSYDNFFAQAYLNRSDAGDTYNLRTGERFTDTSSLIAGQLQHSWDMNEKQGFVYGADLFLTRPETGGTITGRNEDDDNIEEIGGYIQSETTFSQKLSMLLAARVDDHNRLEDPVFSPRAALVFSPRGEHKIRATYNRAYSTPTTNNLFLDLEVASDFTGLGALTGQEAYNLRAAGVPKGGFTFRRDSMGGVDDLYMNVPDAIALLDGVPNPDALPADATQMWQEVLNLMIAGGANPAIGAIPAPPPGAVASGLAVLNPTTQQYEGVPGAFVQDVPQMKPTITNTYELGYKGLFQNRFLAAVDVYHSQIKDFVSPLRVETPNVFFDPVTLRGYLGNFMSPGAADSLTAGMTMVPVGTVAPDNGRDGSDLILTYRNIGDVELTGVDLQLAWYLGRTWTVGATYSWVSKDLFEQVDGVNNIALNAPKNKIGANAKWVSVGLGLEVGGRLTWVDTFPVESGVYVGTVDAYTVVDGQVAYRIPRSAGTRLVLDVQNVFDEKHQQFVGVPELGRVLVFRATQEF